MKSLFLKFIVISFLISLSQIATAQVSGKIFKDFNANGVFDSGTTYNEVGQAGVEVKAYDPLGVVLTVTYTGGGTKTNGTGEYSVASASVGQVRLEFILPDNYIFAATGATGGTSVMFPSTATQNLAVNTPDDYWDNTAIPDPSLIIPIYTQGTLTSAYKDNAGLYALKNSVSSTTETYTNSANQTFPALDTLSDKITLCKMKEIGTVWGVAFDKKNQTYFLSAFAKRHSGEGPLGFGGIYIIQKNTDGTYTKKTGIDLQGVTPALGTTLDLGTITRTNTDNTSDNYIADPIYTPSWDLDAYAKVGTMSYGDADFFDAGQKLFVTNLKQKTLLEIDVSSDISGLSGAALGAKIKSYEIATLPNAPTCTDGVLRVWGLKIYKGIGYLGAVCDASVSQNKNDLKGYILSFDPNNVAAGFTTVLNINLNYRDYSYDWHPWTSNWAQTGKGTPSGGFAYTEPVISDMEFDEKGNMIISVMSITGHKLGFGNYVPISGSTFLINPLSGGDLLQACYDDATKSWTMEGATGCTQSYIGTENINQGYVETGTNGLGEYYDDRSGDGSYETVMGSMAKVMGTNNVVSTVIDPFPSTEVAGEGYWATGGLHFYNTQTGSWNQPVRLYEGGWQQNYGKVYGLGDLEFALTPAPIEIGNRVFMDTDGDGIQDAGEMGLDGIEVELWKAGTKVTSTSTANGGQWYFTNLDEKTDYEVKILSTNIPSGKNLTVSNTASNANDAIDNDAALNGTDAVITYRTGTAGQNNHTLDFGFKVACNLAASANSTNVKCSSGTDGAADVTVTGAIATPTYLWSNGTTSKDLSGVAAGVYTITVSEGICSTSTSVTITEPSDITLDCTQTNVATTGGNDGTATVTATGGTAPYTYLWSNNTTNASISGLVAGTYKVTVTDANGCSKICSSVVTEPSCVPPTAGTNTPDEGSCTNTTPNNDAKVTFTGVTGALKVDRVEGTTYTNGPSFGAASNINASSGNFQLTDLKHSTTYTLRIWQSAACFTDVQIETPAKTCTLPCPPKICTTVKVTKI
jgi:hypothetical protein